MHTHTHTHTHTPGACCSVPHKTTHLLHVAVHSAPTPHTVGERCFQPVHDALVPAHIPCQPSRRGRHHLRQGHGVTGAQQNVRLRCPARPRCQSGRRSRGCDALGGCEWMQVSDSITFDSSTLFAPQLLLSLSALSQLSRPQLQSTHAHHHHEGWVVRLTTTTRGG
jgi:hypothetical protein